jgi:putative tricarboxylic transport membrane protein
MRGVLGAPAMPPDAAAYYEELFAKLSKTPKWQQFVDDGQLDNTFMGTADLNAFLATFEGELRDVLKDSGTKVVR